MRNFIPFISKHPFERLVIDFRKFQPKIMKINTY